MKKIISLLVLLNLFCNVNLFAEESKELTEKEQAQLEQYTEQMMSFVNTFMNGFKNLVDQDEKQEILSKDEKLTGITLFSKKKEGDVITKSQLRIFQILKPSIALVKTGNFPNEILMLLIGDNDDLYYDNQKINIPEGKSAKQVGIYQYTTKNGELKTIPAVKIK